MPGTPDEKDEVQRAMEELYKDGRKPTLQELLDFSKKYQLKLVGVTFPTWQEKKRTRSDELVWRWVYTGGRRISILDKAFENGL